MELVEFEYRKTFHLSYKEMREEPLDVFFTNCEILNLRAEVEQEQQKKTEVRRKLNNA